MEWQESLPLARRRSTSKNRGSNPRYVSLSCTWRTVETVTADPWKTPRTRVLHSWSWASAKTEKISSSISNCMTGRTKIWRKHSGEELSENHVVKIIKWKPPPPECWIMVQNLSVSSGFFFNDKMDKITFNRSPKYLWVHLKLAIPLVTVTFYFLSFQSDKKRPHLWRWSPRININSGYGQQQQQQ